LPSLRELTIFNGSPRGASGNTEQLAQAVAAGYRAAGGTVSEATTYLREEGTHPDSVSIFAEAGLILLAFPLYTDAMPGLVKAFIETLEPLCERERNAPIVFLVHSGFPEGTHSRGVERYLERLAARLHQPYRGTIVKSNSEGIRHQSAEENEAVFEKLRTLGSDLAADRPLNADALAGLASPERFPWWMVPLGHLMALLPQTQSYWNEQLRSNNAYETRFARPYI
jgi:hypothetical protein